jgi:hypothetical protein
MLTAERLREVLDYDPSEGVFRWKEARGCRPARSVAGSVGEHGYVRIVINRKWYGAHRLAWCITHGAWPSEFIDHKDGDPSNNRLANLREATPKQNAENRKVHCNSLSGETGVRWHKRTQMWEARIGHSGRLHHIGYFRAKTQAVAARAKVKESLHTHARDSGKRAAPCEVNPDEQDLV